MGQDNPIGLKVKIIKENETVQAEFVPQRYHQGYKGIVHGGILYSIMDEVMSRAAMTAKGVMTLTIEINIKYRRKAEIGNKIIFYAKMTRDSNRVIETEGKAFSENGELIVEAEGKFFEISDRMKRELSSYSE
jgi:uncharacterized protein (TIGR00369 family)